MHIEISFAGIEHSEALDVHLREQVERELGRYSERLTRIEAHLTDTNAEKSGQRDKQVTLEARPRGMDPITVTDEGADMYAVVRSATRKLSRALSTRFDKADAVR